MLKPKKERTLIIEKLLSLRRNRSLRAAQLRLRDDNLPQPTNESDPYVPCGTYICLNSPVGRLHHRDVLRWSFANMNALNHWQVFWTHCRSHMKTCVHVACREPSCLAHDFTAMVKSRATAPSPLPPDLNHTFQTYHSFKQDAYHHTSYTLRRKGQTRQIL